MKSIIKRKIYTLNILRPSCSTVYFERKMRTSDAIKIFLLSVMALVAELILYFVIAIISAFGGGDSKSTIEGIAKFFGWLWGITAFIGVGCLALVLIRFILRPFKQLGRFLGIKITKEEKRKK